MKLPQRKGRSLPQSRGLNRAARPLPAPVLTERQREILDYIDCFISEHGYSPTLREIAARFEIAAMNGVVCHLRALRVKGCLTWEVNKSRSIRVVGRTALLVDDVDYEQVKMYALKLKDKRLSGGR